MNFLYEGVWVGVQVGKNTMEVSEDGVAWNTIPIQIQSIGGTVGEENLLIDDRLFEIQSISFGNGRFVIIATNKSIKYSLINISDPGDSPSWEFFRLDDFYNNNLPFAFIQFSSVSSLFVSYFNQQIFTSDDGIAWTSRSFFSLLFFSIFLFNFLIF